jgi:hypothetical protein
MNNIIEYIYKLVTDIDNADDYLDWLRRTLK